MNAEERRPASAAPSNMTSPTKSPQTIPVGRDSWQRPTAFQYWLRFDCNRRRREHAARKALYPWTPPPPSTFGLGPDELRRHANDLVTVHGWTVAEVCAVLDIEPAAAS